MTQLETLIQTLCPNGVKFVKLGEAFKRLKGTPITAGTMKQIADDSGDITIVAGGKTVVKAFENEIPNANIIRVPAVLVQSRGVIDFLYYDTPFTFKNEMWAYTTDNQISVKYLYYVLQNDVEYFRGAAKGMGALPQISLPITENYEIPLPPLAVQSEIVRVLDKFTLHKAELAAELAARLQQYEYYRDQLLTFDDTVKRVKLGEVCNVKGRIGFRGYTRNDIVKKGEGAISLSPGNISGHTLLYNDCTYISWMKYDESPEIKVREGDVILCKTGSTLGKVAIVEQLPEKATINPQLVVLKDIKCNNRFLKYILTTSKFQNYIRGRMGVGSVPNISQAVLNELLIPLPPLSEQERIVSILDRFDKLCHDIREGLPAEIELRQKQYEHYRDRLLTFEAAK